MSDFDNYSSKMAENCNAQASLQGGQSINPQQVMRDQRVQSAIWALSEARRVRADDALMAEVRVWVRDKRAEFMALLDEIGG